MKMIQKLLLCEKRREMVAYQKLGRGLTIKECAEVIGISMKNAEYYWETVKERMHAATENLKHLT